MSHEEAWNRWWGQHVRVYTGEEQQGTEYVEQLVGELREFAPNFTPRKILDFGCGLGRILLPLAQSFPQAQSVGVDISDQAIEQAKSRLSSHGVQTSFVNSSTAEIPAGYDLVHSFIVFQHIPVRHGVQRVAELISKLTPGGIGALHFLYANDRPWWRRAIFAARQWIPGVHDLANRMAGKPRLPFTQMNLYPLHELLHLLQQSGCHRVGARFSDHGGHLGVRLMFEKTSLPPL